MIHAVPVGTEIADADDMMPALPEGSGVFVWVAVMLAVYAAVAALLLAH